MIYLIGGAPRTGKSVLGQRVAARLETNWISTDLLKDLLKVQSDSVPHVEWHDLDSIVVTARWFYPNLERFVWGADSLADSYVIDGVDFLPEQADALAARFSVRAVFLGCSAMTLTRFDRYPGRSQGYAALPEDVRRTIVARVPVQSAFVRDAAECAGYPYIDTAVDFAGALAQAEALLVSEMIGG